MYEHFSFYLALIVAIVLLIVLANKIKVAYPVLLVLAGLIISVIPGTPTIHIKPEIIFIIFLPPLLYEAAWSISWKELWRWRRIIGSFAFGVVFLTALSVAFVSDLIIPGFSLALGFLLGGIVSPPDAVSAGAILKFVKVPKRMSSILEGESLLNDASSLIIFRFAMISVATGQFIWQEAALSFSWMIIGGAGIGLTVGWIFMKAHKILPTDANVDIVLTIVAPYMMYLLAEEIHSSGVIAVVSGGLFLSSKRYLFLSHSTRLRGTNVWESLIFVLNGWIFLLIGLDLPEIIHALRLESISLSTAFGYGLLITAVLIVGRIFFSFMAIVVTLVASRFIKVADARNPGYKLPVIFGWTGMRGVVSLAAALSIPVQLNNGIMFPHRNLILFITFVVILSTLLIQGLTLPYLIRKIKLPDFEDHLPENEAEILISKGLNKTAAEYLASNYNDKVEIYPDIKNLVNEWKGNYKKVEYQKISPDAKNIYIDILNQQREWLLKENLNNKKLDEEIVRKFLLKIDMEEARVSFA